MSDENIPKDFEDLVKDVHWLNEADSKGLMMRLKVVEALWLKLQMELARSTAMTDPPQPTPIDEGILSLLVLSGIIAAKIAPAVKLTSEELSQIIKAEGWDIPDLVAYLEKKLNV
jgi:hypothetical protein